MLVNTVEIYREITSYSLKNSIWSAKKEWSTIILITAHS